MTKADIVEQIVTAIGPRVNKDDCAPVIDALLGAVRDALATGDSIQLRGFGTFEVRRRRARPGRNPRSGKPVAIPVRYVPVFRPSKHFRRMVERGHSSSITGERTSAVENPSARS